MTIAGPAQIDLTSSTPISGWNDAIASMKVYSSATFAIIGSWELVGSINGPLERQVQVGTTTSSTTESQTTVTNSFSMSMESGVEFEGVSAKVTMTAGTSIAISNMISNSL
jgi:hypothetical protein